MWFRVDDKLHDHRKARRAGVAAMGLWVLAGSWCQANKSPGFVPEAVIARWGEEANPQASAQALATRLVDACLWVATEEAGEKGFQFLGWETWQPNQEELRERRRAAGRLGGQASAQAKAQARATPSAQARAQAKSKPNPIPIPNPSVSVAKQASEAEVVGAKRGRLEEIAGLTKGDLDYAGKVVQHIAERRPDIRDPIAYALRIVREEPENFRYHKRAPKKSEECAEHPGQYASACAGCAADRLAEGELE